MRMVLCDKCRARFAADRELVAGEGAPSKDICQSCGTRRFCIAFDVPAEVRKDADK